MSTIEEKLIQAQKDAMSIRPKIGGFPVLAEILRQAGVQLNRWSLPSCQSVYILNDGAVVQQGVPLITGTHMIPNFSKSDLIATIRADQNGLSTFPDFLKAIWQAGVIGYEVDFVRRKVAYFGVNGETYLEEYPPVKIE